MEFTSWENLDEQLRMSWQYRMDGLRPPPLLLDAGSQKLNIKEFNPKELGDLIYKDAVLASKILAVANSAQFGLKTPLTSVQRAIVHLGFNLVKTIMITYQMESSFMELTQLPREHLELVSRWSAGSAIFALHWAKDVDYEDPSTSSTLALLNRLGTIVIGNANDFSFEEYNNIETAPARLQYEQEKWGVTTHVLSGYLVSAWGLPEVLPVLLRRILEPLYNEMPNDSESKMLVLICACDALMHHYIVTPDCDPMEILSHEDYQCLSKNLEQHGLLSALGKLWTGMRLQRELAGATGG